MATQTDYWGEIVPAAERTPASIMREQAALLGTKTRNLIEAKVASTTVQKDLLVYSFVLVVPALDNYQYQLFQISHKLLSLYPVTVTSPRRAELPTEEQFVGWLRDILSSPETKKLIGTLLAQVSS